jgi:flavin-dependent dehydrogenase
VGVGGGSGSEEGAFDVAIVGGGPAGTTTALALAHVAPERARRVVVLEKARYPRDKPCAGALGGRGDAVLRALGATIDVPNVAVAGISLRSPGGESRAVLPGAIGRVVRRTEFDHALALAASARGIEVRDGAAVDGVEADGGGVLLRTGAGAVRARCVVGCDGVGSLVRRSIDGDGATARGVRAQVIEVDTPPVAGDRARDLLHFDCSDHRFDGYAWDFPTRVGGEALVCRGLYRIQGERAAQTDLGELLAERLRGLGVDPAGCRNKRYAERGYDPAAVIARGPRMLVGEAAGIDGLTGEWIAQAIEYGAMAGRFLAGLLARGGGAGPLRVDGWNIVVRRSRLARDLRVRRRFLDVYRGKYRADLERFLLECPEGLAVGAAHFAGREPDWGAVGEILGLGAARAAAIAVRALLA